MKKLLLLLLVLMALGPVPLFSQTHELDSLKTIIGKHPQRDSLRVSLVYLPSDLLLRQG
ncbi:hypothetical protein [Paraflavitalea speifideaquila]|uniref:hypothetical protein n=1 Tax=Paraflavitalea speifideaquila TaxID=3076558 RepID=UPI0028EF80A2|nr:hypothetical protein [Paraflavitalea speifideiaquila]